MIISKTVRVTSYFLLSFILLFIILGVILNVFYDKKIIELLENHVSKSTNNEYILSIDKLKINLSTQSLTLNNLLLTPSKKGIRAKTQYVFKIKTLKIVGFSLMSYIRGQNILIDKIEFEGPQVSVFQASDKTSKNKTTENQLLSNTSLLKKLNSISISHINSLHLKLNIYKNDGDTLASFSSNNINLSIQDLSINTKAHGMSDLFFAKKFGVQINNFHYRFDDGLYTIYGKSLYATSLDSALVIYSLKLIPNFSKKEFANKVGRQINRLEIISPKIKCSKLDYNLFIKENKLDLHKVELASYAINVFRDNTFPLAHIVWPSLQAILKNLPLKVSVDTIEMKNGSLGVEILNPGSITAGKISVNKMNIVIAGIQNDTSCYTDKQNIKIAVTGCVWNKGWLKETCIFPLKSTEEFFYCSGSMTSMPMTYFNPMIQPTKHFLIKSGQLDYVSFSFVAHKNSSNGTMKFLYHDLEIELINKVENKNGLKRNIKKLVLNKLIIKDSNPDKHGVIRISAIHAEHNPYRFFLNYVTRSILSGIEPAIIGEKNIKRLKNKKQ
jgi:hypothetical protein